MKTISAAVVALFLWGCLLPVRDTDLSPKDAGSNDAGSGTPTVCDTCLGSQGCAAGEQCGTGGVSCFTCPCLDVCVPTAASFGDADCDQSQCVPNPGLLTSGSVDQIVESGPYAYVSSGNRLLEIEKATGTARVLVAGAIGGWTLRLRGGYLYFLGKVQEYGTPMRVRLSDGKAEALGAPTSFSAASFDVDGDALYVARAGKLWRWTLTTLPAVEVEVTALQAGEEVSDLLVTPTDVWWAGSAGIFRWPRAGGPAILMLPGKFLKLAISGTEVYVLSHGDLTVPSTISRLGTAPGTSTQVVAERTYDFVLARGTLFYSVVKMSGTSGSQVKDVTGAVRYEIPGRGLPFLAVDADRFLVSGDFGLFQSTTTTPVSACGCAALAVVLPPAPAQACAVNLCPPTTSLPPMMRVGQIDGNELFGVFREPLTMLLKLKRFDLTSGASFVYPLNFPAPELTLDATDLYVVDGTDLKRVNRVTGAAAVVLDNVHLPSASQIFGMSGGRLLLSDATHVYFLDTVAGLCRVAKTNGTREVLVGPDAIDLEPSLHLDGSHLYFATNMRLSRVPKAGGLVQLLATGVDTWASFAVNASHVYFRTNRGLERVRKDGGFKSLVLPKGKIGARAEELADLALEGRNLIATVPLTVGVANLGPRLLRINLATGVEQEVIRGKDYLQGVIATPGQFVFSDFDTTTVRKVGCGCP